MVIMALAVRLKVVASLKVMPSADFAPVSTTSPAKISSRSSSGVVALLRVTLALPDRLATLPTGSAAAGCASAGVAGGAAAGAAGVVGDGAGTGCACTICIMSGAASASTPAPSMTPIISSSAKGSRRRVNRIPGRRTRQAGDGDFSRAGLNAG